MTEKTTYEQKGTLRDDCMADRTALDGFRPLESDWRELMRWLMSVSGDLPYYDRLDRESGRLSSLWENHVLTVLIEILQKDIDGYMDSFVDGSGTSAQQKYSDQLRKSFGNWIARLEAFVHTLQSTAADSPSVSVARQMIEQMSAALSQGEMPRPRYSSARLDTPNRTYYRMLGAVEDIQKKGEEYIALIESGGDMDASLSLLLTFVRNYCGMAERFNARFSGWAEFYRKNILHDSPKEAVQDSTHIVIEPDRARKAETFPLPKGTKFIARQNADGSDLLYTTTEKAYIVPAHIDSVHTLFNKGNSLHKVLLLTGEQPDDDFPLFDAETPSATALEHGWMLVSRSLVLSEGRRTVTVCIYLDRTDETVIPDLTPFNGDTSAFILQLSGSEGWRQKEYSIEASRGQGIIRFTFILDEGEEAPAVCTEELHGIATEYPVLRILIADNEMADTLPDDLFIKEININTEVEGIRNFTLIGESGQAAPSQPFYPFGPTGERGSRLIFGHAEAALKNITSVTLKGTWTKLPENGFKPIYANYGLEKPIDGNSFIVGCEWQEESRWHECTASPQPLFRQDGAGKLTDEALFELVLEKKATANSRSLMPYRRDSNGFYRMTLSGPEIGFGTNAYYRRFTEVMMHNGKEKEKNWFPIPEQPQVPMLCDMTFGYRSEETLSNGNNGRLFRFSELFGYEECALNGKEHPVFLPGMESPSLLVGLDNMGDTNRVRLYIDLRYAVRGWKPAGEQPSCGLIVSRYDGNGIWHTMTDEEVVCEETVGLTRSGFIEVKASVAKDTDRLWLKLSFAGGKTPKEMVLDGLWLNCLRVNAENGDGTALPAGTITVPLTEDGRILSISQPVVGSGGKRTETEIDAAIRQRIRISTRNRAVCGGNYEEMILERFPEIEKACCIPASENGGEVRIVVFPKAEKREYPFLPGWKLAEIENHIARYAPPFARIRVFNPKYEPLSLTFKAVLKDGTRDPGTVKRRLARRIRIFLMTWYMDGRLPDFGVRYSCNALLSRIVNDDCIGDFISLEVRTVARECRITEALSEKDTFLAASDECGILYIDRLDVELVDSRRGVDEARIGTDFMIR
jgi:hypothetical protein